VGNSQLPLVRARATACGDDRLAVGFLTAISRLLTYCLQSK